MEKNMNRRFVVCVCVLFLCVGAIAAPSGVDILRDTGVKGGFLVHLGCGDGTLTAELRTGANYVVQGLDTSTANVEKARAHIQSLGLYGVVSANRFDGKRLPYVDNLVNLVVAEDQGQVSTEEIMRVLAPLGVAYVKQGQAWQKMSKPWPAEIDEWRQHFHDADNNAVARDSVVGPPRHVQWIAEPRWSRSHLGSPSVTSMVSSKGRLFDIEDMVSAEYPALPGKFALVARDAFNGVLLWRHPFAVWEPVTRHIKSTPIQLQRRLAAIGDTVYCTPGFDTPVTAFDAATGEIVKTYEGTEGAQEFVHDRGVLYLVVGDPMNSHGDVEEYLGFHGTAFPLAVYGREAVRRPDPKCSIVALDADSGRRMWQVPSSKTKGYQGASLAIRGKRVVFCTDTGIVCLDRSTGDQLWRAPNKIVMVSKERINGPAAMTGIAPSLVLSDDAVYIADVITLKAFSLEDGKELWTGKAYPNHFKASDLFLAAGTVWSGTLEGYDPLTGEVLKTLTQEMTGPMVHDRCYRNRITEHYYIDTKTGGSDFLRLGSDTEFPNPWVRGTCGIGALPCNGLLYAPPSACSCSNWVMMNSLNALAPEPGLKSSAQPIDVKAKERLEKGSAYGKAQAAASDSLDSWPTYRRDPGRTGASKGKAPTELGPRWKVKMSTRASAPTIAEGRLFVADIDAHCVRALDADDGKPLWTYTTGARVDSPPTVYKGLVLFGSRDGWVYCLRASDGALVWRFRGLPDDRLVCAYGQIESAWPVSGSVLVRDDVVYFAAGRNSFIDGGIWLFGLDPLSGRVIHERHMYGPYGDDGFPIIANDISGGFGLHGFKNDVFLTDGETLFLRQQGFRPDLTPLEPKEITEPHLIASAGLLEPIPHHRTWWTIDTTIRYDTTVLKSGRPHGDLLVMDRNRFYEVRGYAPGRTNNFDPRADGYTLYAGVSPKSTDAAPAKKKTSQKPAANTNAKAKARGETRNKDVAAVTRAASSERWSRGIPLTGKAMALADNSLFVAGTPVAFPADDLHKAYEGRMGGIVWAVSAQTGEKIAETKLSAAPAWDGMAVANGRLYISLQDGSVVCLGSR
jgi:outer membrane protein assembly factor BamB